MAKTHRRSPAPSDDTKTTTVRLEPEVWQILNAYSGGSNTSVNLSVNYLLANTLTSPAYQPDIQLGATAATPSLAQLEQLVQKLSGAPDA